MGETQVIDSYGVYSDITEDKEGWQPEASQYVQQRQAERRQLIMTYESLRERSHALDRWQALMALQPTPEQSRMVGQWITVFSNIILLVSLMEVVAVIAPQYLVGAFVAYGLYVLVKRTSPRFLFGASVWALILIAACLGFHQNNLANSFGIMAAYFFGMGLLRSLVAIVGKHYRKQSLTASIS